MSQKRIITLALTFGVALLAVYAANNWSWARNATATRTTATV